MLLLTLTLSVVARNLFRITFILIRTELLSANRENAWLPMAMTKPVVVFYGDVLMVKATVLNVSTIVGGLLTPTSFKKVKCFIIL